MNDLIKYGFSDTLKDFIVENNLNEFELGRISKQHRERYEVWTEKGDFDAEVTGNLRYTAQDSSDFPAVGDWVAVIAYDEMCLIHHILPRKSILERRAVNKYGETQLIATNIDYALIVQSLDNNFSINRFERYISICHAGKVAPILVLNKSDLFSDEEIEMKIGDLKTRLGDFKVLITSAESKEGIESLNDIFEEAKTYCFIGSSGVGKSSLINLLIGEEKLKTREISGATAKGAHTTTHREMILLENGGIIIDTPGMRELGVLDSEEGIDKTFANIAELARSCKYDNCSHTDEPGCAVIEELENGSLSEAEYENYIKLAQESERLKISKEDKRKKDREFGRMVKEAMKFKKKNKY